VVDPRRQSEAARTLAAALSFPEVAERAAAVLGEMGVGAAEALPALSAAAAGRDPARALAAARALLAVDPTSGPAVVQTVRRGLRSSDSTLRRAAFGCLRRLGKDGADAVPDLLALLRDSLEGASSQDPDEPFNALVRLGAGPSTIPLLIRALHQRDGDLRYAAMQCLSDFGREMLPALEAVYNGDDSVASRAARMTIRRINRMARFR
jgi:HEAT repeat protein